ncbi:MAG: BON domain-containing protein [Deltaproteobacteria bacterium]|nr:BON domain-containing protein [Deltaproteobacteria bacterium]
MRRNRLEGEEFRKLRKAGLELRPPVDEYSEQPSSGSAIGGRRGAQEYGIEGGAAQEDGHDRDRASNVDISSSDLEVEGTRFPQEVVDRSYPGVSEYSLLQIGGTPEGEIGQEPFDDEADSDLEIKNYSEIEVLLRERIRAHPILGNQSITVSLTPHGSTVLEGAVRTEAIKLDAQELAQAILGEVVVENRLVVLPGSAT